MRLIAGANQNNSGSRGMTLIGKKTEGDEQSDLDRIIEEDRKNQEKLRRDRDQQVASEQERRANESTADRVLNKATDYAVSGFNVVSKVVKGGMDAYNAVSDVVSKVAEANPRTTKVAGQILTKVPGVGEAFGVQSDTKKIKDAYEKGLQTAKEEGIIDEKTRQWLSDPVLTALNTETGAKATGTAAKSTSNFPLKGIAAVKAIGDNTYDEALSALIEGRNDPTNQRWQKLLYDVQDSGAQSAIGVLVSVGTSFLTRSPKAGQTVGMAYYGALSAESQRQEKGSVTSKKNIAVDTIGDIALGGIVESALKGIIKDSAKRTVGNVVGQTAKGFVTEGSTEVGQTLIKYANDYNDADSEEAKAQVVADVKNYVVSGGLVNELLVGGISGGIITGVTTGAGVAATGKDADPSLQPKKDKEKAPTQAPTIQGKSTLSVEADISKLRDQLGALQAAAQNETEGSAAVEQYSSVRDALSDYEIAFKERPVYIADGSQDSPLLEIETVAYPDGKVAYQFSTDTGGTSFASTFDIQNMLASKEEAIKAASEAVKDWVETELSNASDEAEAIKLQRIYDEADSLLSGKAKFEQVIPAVKENAEPSQEIQQPVTPGSVIELDGTAYKVKEVFKNGAGTQSVILANDKTGREMTMPLTDVIEDYKKTDGAQPVDKKEKPKIEEPKKNDSQDDQLFSIKKDEKLTTKILTDLSGKKTVSKQYILDATNRGDIKQVERNLIREILKDFGETVDVADFIEKVQGELLPLTVIKGGDSTGRNNNFPFEPRYESVTLSEDLRGPVTNYDEHLYQSPIATSAGSIHYNEDAPNYFAHSRIEDIGSNKIEEYTAKNGDVRRRFVPYQTRRIIEIQSDLFQKGRLEKEIPKNPIGATKFLSETDKKRLTKLDSDRQVMNLSQEMEAEYNSLVEKGIDSRKSELSKIEPYRNTWHERIIREEVKHAAIDGKSILLFPTGETAMKIEGLGEDTANNPWLSDSLDRHLTDPDGVKYSSYNKPLKEMSDDLYVGMPVKRNGQEWIITDVLGDGRFKAVTKNRYESVMRGKDLGRTDAEANVDSYAETFDISGKVDTKNPIYRFYEKTVARYLKNRYNAKLITDERGVTWNEVIITEEMGNVPIEAFAITDEQVDKFLSEKESLSLLNEVRNETNPNIRAILQYGIFKELVMKNNPGYIKDGDFSSKEMLIRMSRMNTRDGFKFVLRHETRHAAFVLMSQNEKQVVIDWYRSLSESEKIKIFRNKENYEQYKNGYARRDNPELMMADETANWHLDNMSRKSAVREIYERIMDMIERILLRINRSVFSNVFNARNKQRSMEGLYKDVFSQTGGETFKRNNEYIEWLNKKRENNGIIFFGASVDGFTKRGLFSIRKKEVGAEDTKTTRFAKIISRRRELRELKRKREAELTNSEKGSEIIATAEIDRENYIAPNENVVQGILNNPYFKKEGSIKDAMGEGFLMEKGDRYVVVESKRQETYTERGYRTVMEIDSFASEAGFENGQAYLEDQFARRKSPESADMAIRRVLRETDAIYGKVEDELSKLEKELSEAKEGKGAFFQGMRVGSSIMRKKYNEKLKILKGRKEKVRAAKDFFHLSDNEFKKIGGNRELQTMTDGEFQGFLNHIEVQAEKSILRQQAMDLLIGQIQEKQLKRYDNLRRAMKLPAIDKMTTEQIREFDAALEFSQEGDEFFTQRQLETVKNTELSGIKTVREARERLSSRIGMPVSSLGTIQVSPTLDAMRYDSALADKNPFYKMIVEETGMATLEADGRFIAIEEEANRLISAARSSRKGRGIADRLAPKDSLIFQYLESEDKSELADDMTKEEIEAAEFIRRRYEEMRDYLVEREMLKQYRENYITHVRKGFLETLRDDSIVAAFKDIIVQQQEDEATFNILSGDTGNILPLEKFFQFSLKRKGVIKPTENVATAFLSYTKAFEKKRALDKLIPKLDIYTYSIEPKRTTPNGLQMDRSLKKFLNEYLNNKKGRRIDFGGKLRQGGRADISLRAIRAFLTVLDLGLSIPAGVASNVGEQITNFVMLGTGNYAKGTSRLATFRGRRFLKKYRNFTGKNPWTELAEVSKDTGDKFLSGVFILFRDAQVRANRQFLLGSITDEEFASGEISPQRLAEMQIAMGRWRVVEGAKSLMGTTSLGGIVNQYRTWAIPIVRTTLKDITTLLGGLKKDGLKTLNTREGGEIFRSIVVAGTAVIIVKALLSSGEDKEKDKTMFEKLVDKAIRDLMSTIGVFDPTFFTSEQRVLGFIGDLGTALKSILILEEYSDDAKDGSYEAGDLKGVTQIKKAFTPSAVRQFKGPDESEDKKEKVTKLLKEGLSPDDVADRALVEMGISEEDEEYKTQRRAIEKEAIQQKTVNENGKKVERLNKARLKTTKIRLLKEYQKEMSADEFSKFLDTVYDGKIISKPILDEF